MIDVVYCVDDAYVDGAIGSARSVVATTGWNAVAFHVIDGGLDDRSRMRIETELAPLGPTAVYPFDLPDIGARRKHYDMPAAVGRLYMGDLLPAAVDRAVYLDGDTVALEDITALFEVDLAGNAVAGVVNPVSPTRSVRVGDTVTRSDVGAAEPGFFNSGVLVVDLARWRAEDVAARADDLCRRFGPSFHGVDQEILNVLFAGRWTSLDAKWNTFVSGIDPALRPPGGAAGVLADPRGILHFVGPAKPWQPAFDEPSLLHLYRTATAAPAAEGERPPSE